MSLAQPSRGIIESVLEQHPLCGVGPKMNLNTQEMQKKFYIIAERSIFPVCTFILLMTSKFFACVPFRITIVLPI